MTKLHVKSIYTILRIHILQFANMRLQQTPGYSNRHLFELPADSNRFSFPVDIP